MRIASPRSRRVALQFPDLAAQQLEQGVKKFGLRGAAIGGSVAGQELLRSEVPSVLGEGRRARRGGVHPSAADGRPHPAAEGQRPADQHHLEPARDDDRALASDLRRHARPVSDAEDLRRARRRLPAVVHEPLRPRLRHVSRAVHAGRAEGASDGVREADVLRFAGVHARSAAASGGRSRREPDRDRHRLSLPRGSPSRWSTCSRRPGLSDADREAILGGTAAKLLELPDVASRSARSTHRGTAASARHRAEGRAASGVSSCCARRASRPTGWSRPCAT